MKTLVKIQKNMSPSRMIAISFLTVIIFGGLMLCLPISHQPGVEVAALDAFFTATSAVCVTGLVTHVTATTWSIFGKIVILILIQIGGLSLITIFTYFIIHLGRKVTLKERMAVQAAYSVNDLSGMARLVLLVIRVTFLCEGIGAILLTFAFLGKGFPWYDAVANGIFHGVSAFCNAGFDNIGELSLMPYATDPVINFVIMGLIIMGGIGFTVWRDLGLKVKYQVKQDIKRSHRLSLHSKLVLIATAFLLVAGAAYFLIAEYDNPKTLGPLSDGGKVMSALFQSVTLRTAGFYTIAQNGLSETSKIISSILMLIGGSPGGTAGGMKTVTIAIVFLSVWSTLHGRRNIVAFGRTLPAFSLLRALSIIVIMLLIWLGGGVILAMTEHGSVFAYTTADLLFEVASALGTVGLTTGITPFLSIPGKLLLMLCMFVGRIGPITFMLSLQLRTSTVNERIQYPSEDVMIG